MKKVLALLFAISAITLLSCDKEKKDDPIKPVALQKQRSAIFKQTGTWCGACPSAATKFKELTDTYEADFIGIALHGAYDEVMEVPALFSSFRSDRNSSSFPSLFIDEKIIQSQASDLVSSWLAMPCQVGVDFLSSISGDQMKVDVQVKFFEGLTGQYYLSVYILENGIDGGPDAGEYAQTSGWAGYTHDHVLRTGADQFNYYGELLTQNPAAQTTIDKSFTIVMDPSWVKDNCYVAVVVWSYDPSTTPRFHYVNAIQKGSH